jgi:hypothetical protein
MSERPYRPFPNTVAAGKIRSQYPPGTKLRHKTTGKIYVIGARFGINKFWLMQLDPPDKGIERADTILRLFEAAE